MANEKKYASLESLQSFLENIKTAFAKKSHTHTVSDISDIENIIDIAVDTELSSTSNNPVANSTLNAEFDAISEAMNVLEAAIDDKADSGHTHDDRYYTETEIDTKLSGKADTSHNHDSDYDAKGSASAVQTNLDVVDDKVDAHVGDIDVHVTTTNKSNWNTAYTHSQAAHARTDATKVADSTTNGNILINGTETNVYTHPSSGVTAGTYKSVTVNAQGHVTGGTNPTTLAEYGITDAESKGAASSALASAKEYTDTKTAILASTSTVDSKISSHNTSTSAHNDIRALITNLTTKLNNFLDVDDTTTDQLSEVITLINNNKGTLESLTTSKVNVSDIVNNLTTNSTSKVLSAAQGVAIKSLIDALQAELDSIEEITSAEIKNLFSV